jgi:hypothetical protein
MFHSFCHWYLVLVSGTAAKRWSLVLGAWSFDLCQI